MRLRFAEVDAVTVVAALAALLCALRERRRILKHWQVLLPGLFAAMAAAAIVAYPRWSDLWESQRFAVGLVALLVGGLRGRFMTLATDRLYGAVALRNPFDSAAVAGLQLVFAVLELALGLKNYGLSRISATVELVLIVTAAYLIGRSLALWMKARTGAHADLVND